MLKLKKNKTVLDVKLKQIITSGVEKWGPDNRAAAETRAEDRLVTGRRTSCSARFQFPDFSEAHLHIWDKICWGVQSQSQIYFIIALLFTLLPKKTISSFHMHLQLLITWFWGKAKPFITPLCSARSCTYGHNHTPLHVPALPWWPAGLLLKSPVEINYDSVYVRLGWASSSKPL